jgi:hypothetical protein
VEEPGRVSFYKQEKPVTCGWLLFMEILFLFKLSGELPIVGGIAVLDFQQWNVRQTEINMFMGPAQVVDRLA